MIQELYNYSFDLYGVDVIGRNIYGGITTTITLRQTGIPCYFTYMSGREAYRYGKQRVIHEDRLFCSKTYIKSTDVVYVPSKDKWYSVLHIDNCNNMEHHYEVAIKAYESPQCLNLRYGWTWGYEHPVTTLPESWRTWNYIESINEAENSGNWGQLLITGLRQFCSPVKDTGSVASKTITLSYDDYSTGSHNGNRIIWWRGSNSLFAQSDSEITGPNWILYSGSFNTSLRYLQIKTGIY